EKRRAIVAESVMRGLNSSVPIRPSGIGWLGDIPPEGFFETYMPVPPIEEQREIVRHIAAETSKIDRLRAATEHSITLLKERRGALIAAAVTGQIDIPEPA